MIPVDQGCEWNPAKMISENDPGGAVAAGGDRNPGPPISRMNLTIPPNGRGCEGAEPVVCTNPEEWAVRREHSRSGLRERKKEKPPRFGRSGLDRNLRFRKRVHGKPALQRLKPAQFVRLSARLNSLRKKSFDGGFAGRDFCRG